MHGKPPADEEALKMLHANATLPELVSWLERNADRAAEFRAEEIGELLEMQEPGGPLERLGVTQFVELLERRRKLLVQVRAIAATEYLVLVEQLVCLVYEKVQKTLPSSRVRT